MEKRIFGILQKSSYITLGSLSCHTIVLFRNCVLLPWPARILVYSLANYSCHNNNTIQVLLLFQHYCCKPVAQLHSAQKKTMKQPKAGKCHFFRNCSWFAPWPISLVTIILFQALFCSSGRQAAFSLRYQFLHNVISQLVTMSQRMQYQGRKRIVGTIIH